MRALRASAPGIGVAEAERIARDFYGLAGDVTPLSGERDSNFRVCIASEASGQAARDFVLKVFDVSADPLAVDCQVRALRHCAEQDATLPVPRLYATLAGDDLGRFERSERPYASCLLGFLPGQLLASHPAAAPLRAELGRTLACLDKVLQGFMHPALLQQLAWDVRRLPQLAEHFTLLDSRLLRGRVEAAAEAIKERLPALRGLRSQAIHGDCHGGNLLIDPATDAVSGIVDFGDMLYAPMIMELGVSLAELLLDGVVALDGLPEVINGYARERALLAEEVMLLYDLVVARQAITLVLHAWRRRHDPAGAELLAGGAGRAREFLDEFERQGREALTQQWQEAAADSAMRGAAPVTLARRHRLMGAGAELFYEQPLHLVRGRGVWLYDPDGHAYLDVYNNVPHVGHAHPHVVAAISRQTATLSTHTRYLHAAILDYAEMLTATLPAHLDTCLFVNSGSEANDVAWRMAQFATGREGALIMHHAYHGITASVAALTPAAGPVVDPRVAALASPPAGLRAHDVLAPQQVQAAIEDVNGAIAALAARGYAPAAFFVDTALTSSGVFDPPPAWGAAVGARLKAGGVMVVADEVQYGLGRSGSHFWGFERRGLVPDLVTLGKPVANGYPMGVVVANRALVEAFQARFGFFSTFGGGPVAAVAGRAVLEVLAREDLMGNALTTGNYLRAQLESVANRQPQRLGQVRGAGLLIGLEVLGQDPAAAKARTSRLVNLLAGRHRILIGSEGPKANLLKLRPPLPFAREHADLLVQAIAEAVEQT